MPRSKPEWTSSTIHRVSLDGTSRELADLKFHADFEVTKIPGSYPSSLHQGPAATSSSVITLKATDHRGVPSSLPQQQVQEPAQTQSEIPSRLEDEHWQVTHKQERSSGHMSVDEPESPPQTQILPATHRSAKRARHSSAM
jgi:hypothetical protein